MSEYEQPRFPIAEYKDSGVPEYTSNPLIAALPNIMTDEDARDVMAKKPNFSRNEANLDDHIRHHIIGRLERDFFVPQLPHIILQQRLSNLIRISYLGRNPQTATFKRKLNSIRDDIQKQDLLAYINTDGNSYASSMAISGISGVGKTTTVNAILNKYQKVIFHPSFHLLQVPWIKVDCPLDGSLSEFCESFFIALDRRLNSNYRRKYMSGRPTIGKMIADVADLCLIHAIGLLVVDEFQHMNLAKSGGEKKMINFLVTLVNVVEVSVVLIGTPKALKLFSSEFRQARRASGQGSIIWDRIPYDDSWDDFLNELWPFQWLKSPHRRDEGITLKLYELTQGVPYIVVLLFCLAQRRLINLRCSPEDEFLSCDLLDEVFDNELSQVKPMLDALRTGNKKDLDKYNDLEIPKLDHLTINAFDQLKTRPIPKKHRIDLGDPEVNSKAGAAIDSLVRMGVSSDIAPALVADLLTHNPDTDIASILDEVSKSLQEENNVTKNRSTKERSNIIKPEHWIQLSEPDLRKIYAEKTGTMYESLKERGVIYPIDKLLGR